MIAAMKAKKAKANGRRVCQNPHCSDPIGKMLAGDPGPFREALLEKQTKAKGKRLPGDDEDAAGGDNGKTRIISERLQAVNLDPGRIDRSPYQPRQDFSKEEISSLAESIRVNGQLVAITVRAVGDRYELIFGERRLRAVKQLGLTQVRAELVDRTDAQVREMIVHEALQRKDLNAIEEAAAFRRMIDAGDAAGPTELAKQLGLSQGHVSNRLRLLELPAAWQKRVISHEIPATHARSIVRYAGHPAILAEIDKEIKQEVGWRGAMPSAEEFDDLVDGAADSATSPIDGTRYSSKFCKHVSIFAPTDEEREQLGIVEIPQTNGKTTLRATNTKLWDKLQEQHEARLAAKADKKGTAKDAKDKPLTPAERKRIEAEEAKKQKERAAQFRRRLVEWKEDWMRHLIADELRKRADVCQIARVLMLALAEWGCSRSDLDLGAAMGNGHARSHAVRDVCAIQDFDLDRAAGNLAAQMFYDAETGPVHDVFGSDLEALCEFLDIDLGVEWNNHQAGPLSEAYWRLHTKDQLVALASELKAEFEDAVLRGTKDTLVSAFVARIPGDDDTEAGLLFPKELRLKLKGG